MDSYESVVHSGDKTSIAIVGMPASSVSDTLERLEDQFQMEAGKATAIYKLYHAETLKRWPRKANLLKIAVEWAHANNEATDVARQQVEELALAHAKAINDAKATAAQADFYKQYLELAAQLRELRNFFAEHYSSELERALVQNVNLLDLAKQIMLKE